MMGRGGVNSCSNPSIGFKSLLYPLGWGQKCFIHYISWYFVEIVVLYGWGLVYFQK